METINNWGELVYNSLNQILVKISGAIPSIVGAFFVLLLGWLLSKILIYVLKRTMSVLQIDKVSKKVNSIELFGENTLKIDLKKIIIGALKFSLLLIILVITFDILNWQSVSNEIANLLRYLPKLFSALALFLVGLYLAKFIKSIIQNLFSSFDIMGSKVIASIVFYLIIVLVTITSLNQAGIDTSIITNNLALVLGSFLLSFSISFGFGSKDVIQKLLYAFYSKRNFEIGQNIEIDDIVGEIIDIDNICISIQTKDEIIIVPITEIVENRVKIKK